jgi:hypothetical protein
MTYQFDTDIAAIYGVDEAVIIANLEHWIRHNIANDKHYHDGRYWTYNSIDAFTKLFPFWTARQIRRILQSLIEQNVLMTGNYNSSARDRTMWYAFTDEFVQKRQMHLTKTSNGNDGTVKSNIDSSINKETSLQIENTDNKPADGGLFPSEPGFVPVTVTRPRRTSEPAACLFENSRFVDYNAFAAEFGDCVEDFRIICGDENFIGVGGDCPFINMLDHYFSAERSEDFAREAGACVTGGDYDIDFAHRLPYVIFSSPDRSRVVFRYGK